MKRRIIFILPLLAALIVALSAQAESGPWRYRLDAAGFAHITAYDGEENQISVPESIDGIPVIGLDAGALSKADQVYVPVSVCEIAENAIGTSAVIISRHGAAALDYARQYGLHSESLTGRDLTALVVDLTDSDYAPVNGGFTLNPALFRAVENSYAVYIPEDECAYQITASEPQNDRVFIKVAPWETLLTYNRVTITASNQAANSTIWQNGIQVNQRLDNSFTVPILERNLFSPLSAAAKFSNIEIVMDLDTKTMVENMLIDGQLTLLNPVSGIAMALNNSADCILYMRIESDVALETRFTRNDLLFGSHLELSPTASASASYTVPLIYGFMLDLGLEIDAAIDRSSDFSYGITSQHIGFEYTSGGGMQSLYREGSPWASVEHTANVSAGIKVFASVNFAKIVSLLEANYGLEGELGIHDEIDALHPGTALCKDISWNANWAGQYGLKLGLENPLANASVGVEASKKWKLFGLTGEFSADAGSAGFHASAMIDFPSKNLDIPIYLYHTFIQSGDTEHFELNRNGGDTWEHVDACTRYDIDRLLVWDPDTPILGSLTQHLTTDDYVSAYPERFTRIDATLKYWYDAETGERWDIAPSFSSFALQSGHFVDWAGTKTMKACWEEFEPAEFTEHEYPPFDPTPGASVGDGVIFIPGHFSDPQAVALEYMATHPNKDANGDPVPWPDYPFSVRGMDGYAGTSLVFGDRVRETGQVTNAYNLTSVTLHDGMTSVGSFDGCIRLQSIALPSGNTGKTTFVDCLSLSSVSLPGTMTEIYDNMFQNCRSLRSIVIPEGVTRIGAYAFSGSGIESITLPSTLKTIDEYAFYNSQLKSIALPEGLTEIGSRAFAECPNLTSITIPASVQRTDPYLFRNDTGKGNFLLDILWKAPLMDANISGRQLENMTVDTDGSVTLVYALDSKNVTVRAENMLDQQNLGSFHAGAATENIKINTGRIDGAIDLSGAPGLKTVEINCDSMGDLNLSNSGVESVIIHCRSMGAIDISYCDNLKTLILDGEIDKLTLRHAIALEGMEIGPIKSEEENALIVSMAPRLETLKVEAGTAPTLSAFISECEKLREIDLPNSVTTSRFYMDWPRAIVYGNDSEDPVKVYALSFESDFGQEAASKMLAEGAGTAFPIPSRTFLTFGGWYLDQALTEAADEDSFEMPAKDTTLYARWIADQENSWSQYDGATITFLNGPDNIGIIPEGVAAIANIAVWSELKAVRISASVSEISSENFRFAEKLRTISVDPGNTHFYAQDNMLFSSDGTLLAVACDNDTEYLSLPDGLTAIGNYCFAHLGGKVQELQIPDTVIQAGVGIFENLSPAISVYGPSAGPGAEAAAAAGIRYNEYPVLVLSGDLVLGISSGQLGEPVELPDVSSEGKTFLGWSAARNGALITGDFILPEGGAALYAVWEEHTPSLADYTGQILYLPDALDSIGAEAFLGIAARAVVIPAHCGSIGSRAFADSDGLAYVQLSDGLAYIAPDAFENSSNVTLAAPADSPWRDYAQSHGLGFVPLQ